MGGGGRAVTEVCDEECDSPELVNQRTQEESPTEVHTAEDVPVVAEVQALSEGYDIEAENNSSERLQDQTDEEPAAKVCEILDRSQALNVPAQQNWPLLELIAVTSINANFVSSTANIFLI